MDKLLYVSMNGAKQTMLAQNAVSHNLSNASTTGFKKDYMQFRSLPVYGETYPSRAYAVLEKNGSDLSPGSIITTGNDMDIAINGDGWFAVQDKDGKEAYTRAGDLHLTGNGQIQTGAGYVLMGNGGPIALPPAETVEIAPDGSITIRPVGQASKSLVLVDRIKLVNPPVDKIEKGSDGLFRVTDPKLKVEADAFVKIASGALEASNVNTVESMVEMINLSRQFEMQVKMMQTAKQNDEAAAQLMRLS